MRAPDVRFRVILVVLLLFALLGCSGSSEPDAEDIAANNRGVGLMGMYEYRKAHDVFAALAETHPDWVDVKVNLAIATLNRQEEGDETRALEILRDVLERDPDDLRAHYCAGALLYRQGDPSALAHLELVAASDPADPYAAYFYGSALEQAGRAEAALAAYRRAFELDPYLSSAAYRASRILLRDPQTRADGLAVQETFTRLEGNPRARKVDFIYTQMGPKAEARAVGLKTPKRPPRPEGPVFGEPRPLLAGEHPWRAPDGPASVTAADLSGDGRTDVFIAAALDDPPNAVIVATGSGFELDATHPLAAVTDVNAALWGDYDNDGMTDAYLCRRGPNQLWRQTEPGRWSDVTASTGTAGGAADTVDGAIFDADHDGDLDIFCVNADAPNEMLSNNLDGTFRPIAADGGIAGDGRPSLGVLVADLDRDRDADIVVINDEPPNEVYLNDRLWQYRPAAGFADLRETRLVAAVAADLDADGRPEVYGREPGGSIVTVHGDAGWPANEPMEEGMALAVADLDGDGWRRVFGRPYPGWTPVVLDPARGPAIVGVRADGVPVIEPPGPGRHGFAALAFTGKDDAAQSMRSNASGIGAWVAVRVRSQWTAFETFRSTSGPGQGLSPVAVGLGGAETIDFVSIDWPDGVLQTEVGLTGGALHVISETQRQTSSCPVLFAWDGERYAFVSDLLGVGGIGYLVAPGEYAEPRPWENFLLPEDLLAPRDGRYVLKLGEPMQEACYLDWAQIVVHDLPPGWSMVVDERMGIAGPAPTGEPRFYRRELLPAAARTGRGEDAAGALRDADLDAAPVGELDRRFIGRLERPNIITLIFGEPLEADHGPPVLVADGWIEYPYAQTMFAAWQAGAAYDAPTVESRGQDGAWHTVLAGFGYPAGMPRRMSVPLEGLPAGADRLRITTNQEIYWDRLAVAFPEPPPPEHKRQVLRLAAADVRRSGFAERTTGPQRQPHYDYDRRTPFWDTRHQTGHYTRFGPATELVASADGALAIIGPGEEIHLEFDAGLEPLPEGWTRRFVLETRGWCKDMDLYTRDGRTLAPIPGDRDAPAQALHERYNTRYESGR